MAKPSAHASKNLLDRETDARFWAQTGYKVHQKLDPGDPTDAAMAKVWRGIFKIVQAEDRAGKLVVTYNSPTVERALEDAEMASHATSAHMSEAATASDPGEVSDHVRAASAATASAASSARAAARAQPATVPLGTIIDAAREIRRSVADATTRAASALSDLAARPAAPTQGPAGFPVNPYPEDPMPPEVSADPGGSPASGPVTMPSQVLHAPRGPVTMPSQVSMPATHAVPGVPMFHAVLDVPATSTTNAPPWSAESSTATHDPLSAAQANAAVDVAVAVHTSRDRQADPRAMKPKTVANIRAAASAIAQIVEKESGKSFVGVTYDPKGNWDTPTFASAQDAADWYGRVTDQPDKFLYASYFDRNDGTWPAAVNELFGSGRAITASVRVERPSAAATRTSYGPVVALAAVAGVGGLAFLAGRRRNRTGGL